MKEPGEAGAKTICTALGTAAGVWLFSKLKLPKHIGGVIGGVIGAWVGERLGPIVVRVGGRLGKRFLVIMRRKPALPSP